MIFAGGPGCGKTTVARAIASELGIDVLFINASEHGNIDTLRTTIRNFASTISLSGEKPYKLVILDEGDNLNPQSFQPALRGFIEEFAKNCRFIITCNFKNKIIEAIQSRCPVIDFVIPVKERSRLASQMLKRVISILDNESIKYDEQVLVELIKRHFPDYRRILGEIQTYSLSGEIDSGILAKHSDVQVKDLVDHMKAKNFTEVRKWVALHVDMDPALFFRKLYEGLNEYVDKSSIPQMVLILAEYQYKLSFSADAEICLAACMVEIMLSVSFK
jgi:DNA polymerase III delta prime subunit